MSDKYNSEPLLSSIFSRLKAYLSTARQKEIHVQEVWISCDSCGVVVDSMAVGWNCPNCGGEVSADE